MGRIILEDVKKSFGDFTAIQDINLEVEDGEFVVLVGPSGCGKSTLLRLIAGLEDCTSGKIFIDGKDVTNVSPAQRRLSMVFQSYALYPHMTVRGNIAFGLKMAKESRQVIEEKVTEAARILDLSNLLDRKPGQLSGGQRQRVAIGRAIVRHPEAFLLDEPLSNLDAALRVQMRLEIAQLHQSLATTMIYVTHDQVEAMTLADKIVVLHDGIIEQVGSPIDLYERPDNQFVAGFIGSPKMNFIENGAAQKNGTAVLGIRPEHVAISGDAGDYQGRVKIAEHLGSDTFLYVDAEHLGTVTVRATGEVGGRPGDTVWLSLPPDLTHHFDSDGRAVSQKTH